MLRLPFVVTYHDSRTTLRRAPSRIFLREAHVSCTSRHIVCTLAFRYKLFVFLLLFFACPFHAYSCNDGLVGTFGRGPILSYGHQRRWTEIYGCIPGPDRFIVSSFYPICCSFKNIMHRRIVFLRDRKKRAVTLKKRAFIQRF